MKSIQIGDRIPGFALRNQEDKEVYIDPDKGTAKIIYFYPRNNTRYCTEQACTFRDWKDLLSEKGFELIGISRDSPGSHQKFRARHHLNFTLLSDPGSKIRRLFCGSYLFGIIPSRRTFVVNEKGVVEFVYKGLFQGMEHVQGVLKWIENNKKDD